MKTKDQLIAFENRVKELFAAGELPFLVHMSGGNEDQLIDIFSHAKQGDWFFSTHRSHSHYLLAGGNEENLLNLIKTGSSMFVFDSARNFLTSSILAGTACIAVGVALQLKAERSSNRVWCFLGDGAEEEGHFYEAVLMAHGNDLPVTFVIEDNDRSVDSPKAVRTKGKRIDWPSCVVRYSYKPTYPHAGAGLPPGSVRFNPAIVSKYAS